VNLKEEAAVVDKADLPWAKLVALQDAVHQMEVSNPLEGSYVGLFQNKAKLIEER
jgi:hypothetical protein